MEDVMNTDQITDKLCRVWRYVAGTISLELPTPEWWARNEALDVIDAAYRAVQIDGEVVL